MVLLELLFPSTSWGGHPEHFFYASTLSNFQAPIPPGNLTCNLASTLPKHPRPFKLPSTFSKRRTPPVFRTNYLRTVFFFLAHATFQPSLCIAPCDLQPTLKKILRNCQGTKMFHAEGICNMCVPPPHGGGGGYWTPTHLATRGKMPYQMQNALTSTPTERWKCACNPPPHHHMIYMAFVMRQTWDFSSCCFLKCQWQPTQE